MSSAMSPRYPAPRLKSTEKSPRKKQSDLQKEALAKGITFRAGPTTIERLHRGVVQVNFRSEN
jgi:hypothetical protein